MQVTQRPFPTIVEIQTNNLSQQIGNFISAKKVEKIKITDHYSN